MTLSRMNVLNKKSWHLKCESLNINKVKKNLQGFILKNILALTSFFLCFQIYGQDLNYIERMRLVEKFGHENKIKLHEISPAELAKIMRHAGGLDANDSQAGHIQSKIRDLDQHIHELYQNKQKATKMSVQQNVSGVPDKEAEIIANLINSHSNDPTPQTFLAAGIARAQGMKFLVSKYLEELKKLASRPSLPTSPTSISLKRIFKRTSSIQKLRMPKVSGDGDYFSNAYMSLDYNYTEFKDESVGNSGQIHDFSLGLHGTILESTDLSFGLIANEAEANGSVANNYRSETFGFDTMIHHKLNDNYGLGVYGFYQHSKFEKLDTKDYGAGYGFLFSTWYDLNLIELSTVTSWTKTYYEAGNDTLFNGTAEITRYWTDKFSTSLRASYTDSLDNDVEGDNSYWSLGGSIGYMVADNLHISLSYTTDKAIKNYESETWGISLAYYF